LNNGHQTLGPESIRQAARVKSIDLLTTWEVLTGFSWLPSNSRQPPLEARVKESKVLRGRGKCFSTPYFFRIVQDIPTRTHVHTKGVQRWQTPTPGRKRVTKPSQQASCYPLQGTRLCLSMALKCSN